MSNPYEDFKQEKGLVKYLCNKCKHPMGEFETDEGVDKAKSDLMGIFGQMSKHTPAAFYCINNKCERYGLLTKVAIKV